MAAEIPAAWKWYVYELSDAHGVFYVGKGSGPRIRRTLRDGSPAKLARAADCAAAIVAHFRHESDALRFERNRMLEYSGLTNIASYGDGRDIESMKRYAESLESTVLRGAVYVHERHGDHRRQLFALFEILSAGIKSCREAVRVRELVGLQEFVTRKLLRASKPLQPAETPRSIICSA